MVGESSRLVMSTHFPSPICLLGFLGCDVLTSCFLVTPASSGVHTLCYHTPLATAAATTGRDDRCNDCCDDCCDDRRHDDDYAGDINDETDDRDGAGVTSHLIAVRLSAAKVTEWSRSRPSSFTGLRRDASNPPAAGSKSDTASSNSRPRFVAFTSCRARTGPHRTGLRPVRVFG